MYPASNNCNHNPISFSGQVTPNRSLFNTDINPSSKFEDPHSTSSFHFPSPFIQYEDAVNEVTWQQLDDLFMITRQQPMVAENSVAEIISNMEDPKRDAVDGLEQEWHRKSDRLTEQITRKRSSKDRHSKINTAHGPRDRRMRLSLDVARKFFDLQDILGFDKASKTVEWLLIKSSSAIKEIMRGLPRMRHSQSIVGANISVSSTSECTEVVSGIDDSTTNDNQQPSISIKVKMKSCCKKEKRAKLARPTALLPLTRESRKVARERARKRTIEKNRLSESKLSMEAKNSTDLHRLESWGHFGTVEESGLQGCKLNPSYEGLTEVEEPKSQERRLLESIREIVPNDILVVTGNWNPSSIYNYQENAEVSHEHHQFSDFQLCGKTWEAYKNMSLGG